MGTQTLIICCCCHDLGWTFPCGLHNVHLDQHWFLTTLKESSLSSEICMWWGWAKLNWVSVLLYYLNAVELCIMYFSIPMQKLTVVRKCCLTEQNNALCLWRPQTAQQLDFLPKCNLNLTVPLVPKYCFGQFILIVCPKKRKALSATVMILGVLSSSDMRLGFAQGFMGFNVSGKI